MINLLRRLRPHVFWRGCTSVSIPITVLHHPLKSEGENRSFKGGHGTRVWVKISFHVQCTESIWNPPIIALAAPLSFGGLCSCLCQVPVVHKTRHLQYICLKQGDDKHWNRCWKAQQQKACAKWIAHWAGAVWWLITEWANCSFRAGCTQEIPC